MPVRLEAAAPGFDRRLRALIERRRDEGGGAERAAAEIIARIRAEGDAALIELTHRFDRIRLSPERLRIGAQEIVEAVARCEPRQIEALAAARARIADYHRRQLPEDADYLDGAGVRLGWRWRPIDAVGLYVPGRHRRLSELGADDGRAGQGRGRRPAGHDGSDAGRDLQSAGGGGGAAGGGRRDLPDRRRPGDRSARLRHAHDRAGGQDC